MSHTKSRFILAFVAGFLSVLLFHQGMLALLHALAMRHVLPIQPLQHSLLGYHKFGHLRFGEESGALFSQLLLLAFDKTLATG
jgi:hypothetical protein